MTRPGPVRILFGNEPRAYREALAAAFRVRCPSVEVIVVDSVELDAHVVQYAPALVVCSKLTMVVETEAPVWALLYPDGAPMVVTSVAGSRESSPDLDLDQLCALANRAVELLLS